MFSMSRAALHDMKFHHLDNIQLTYHPQPHAISTHPAFAAPSRHLLLLLIHHDSGYTSFSLHDVMSTDTTSPPPPPSYVIFMDPPQLLTTTTTTSSRSSSSSGSSSSNCQVYLNYIVIVACIIKCSLLYEKKSLHLCLLNFLL